MTESFAQLGLPDKLVDALARLGIVEPFPIQAASIPDALDGVDIAGKAPTGSGKTLAFGLPMLVRVQHAERQKPTALVLAPTRELAEQIKVELTPLARAAGRYVSAVYGGVGYGPQRAALRKGVDVLVATPGRLEDLIDQRSVDLSRVTIAVVDEADRMADMGFLPAVRRILDQTSSQRQTMLFSATLDGDVAVLSRDYQRHPVRHDTGAVETDVSDAAHHFWLVDRSDRARHAAEAIEAMGSSIVFTRTRHGADRLAKQLAGLGIDTVALHGGRSQSQRSKALRAFSSGRVSALIATDVAARGIHVDDVASVIHFDVPADAKDYLHRSGRTARAGAGGTVLSLVSSDQQKTVRKMQQTMGLETVIGRPVAAELSNGGAKIEKRVVDEKSNPERKPAEKRRNEGTRRQNGHRPQASNGGVTRSIYVSNLPWRVTDDDLRTMFARYGNVQAATVMTDRRTGRSRGFGFVDLASTGVQDAVSALDGHSVDGRDLQVSIARPRRARR